MRSAAAQPPLSAAPAADRQRGLTPREYARVLRVGTDRVLGWIRGGALGALNLAGRACGKPRYVILPTHREAFERSRQAATTTKPAPRRRRVPATTDYYPD